ncbi:MAG: hypothetical protein KDD22_04560 [Bdellovibrionales bacterium]|nr:hypothetical protein [Bdellovibrionales bacterium]
MSSNEAVNYHLEGQEKGWGDVISPRQELFFLKETYINALGTKSWELKTGPTSESDTAKVLKDLSRLPGAGTMAQVRHLKLEKGSVFKFTESRS